jgi:hypothetical protein
MNSQINDFSPLSFFNFGFQFSIMRFIITFLGIFFGVSVFAQNTSRFPPLDKSPLDMSYYPTNYPVLKIQPNKKSEPLIARVIYSRPQKSGRKVFEELVEKGKIWRLGANEATEIEFFKDVKIGNQKVKRGRYTLYAIENDSSWTIIINTELDVWGAFKYDITKDVVRAECPIVKTEEITEAFSMVFEKVTDTSIRLVIGWDNVQVALPVSM